MSQAPLATDNPARALRPIRFVGYSQPQPGWTFKWYGIQADAQRQLVRDSLDAPLLKAAQAKAADVILTEASSTPRHHKVGFGIVHQGKLGNWTFIDWWAQDILLYNRLYRSSIDNPLHLAAQNDALLACIWELRVFAFEREAWVHALRTESEPQAQLDTYLKARLDGEF